VSSVNWSLLTPWLAASRYEPRWRELKQIGVASPLADTE